MTTLDQRLAKWRADLARETRQRDAAQIEGRMKAAAIHQDQIDRLTTRMTVHSERHRPIEQAGAPM